MVRGIDTQVPLVGPARLAEDRRVQPDRAGLEERHDLAVHPHRLAGIDSPDLSVAEHVGGHLDIPFDAERSG